MSLTKDDLSRRFFLEVTKSGHVFIREKGSGPSPHGALAVFSTDRRHEAEQLRVRHCRLARDGSGLYQLNEFSGEVEDLHRVADLFRRSHAGDPWGTRAVHPQPKENPACHSPKPS